MLILSRQLEDIEEDAKNAKENLADNQRDHQA